MRTANGPQPQNHPNLDLKHLVHNLRVGVALHGFHRLADEEAEQRFLA
jgi:hypothetical protein